MESQSTLPNYADVTIRFLYSDERPFQTFETRMPLVIEAKQQVSVAFLKDFLRSHSSELLQHVAEYGAVLLRGFELKQDRDCEELVLSIKNMRPMDGYFLSELGRDRIPNTRYMFYTNTFYKTGGSFLMGKFHSENYYSIDVPSFICFFCIKNSWFGGETGLIDTTRIYHSLDEQLKQVLADTLCCPMALPLSYIQQFYELPDGVVEKFFRSSGLKIDEHNGEKIFFLCKPNIYKHPDGYGDALQVSLGIELPKLNHSLFEHIKHFYKGYKWSLHKLTWRYNSIAHCLAIPSFIVILGKLLFNPSLRKRVKLERKFFKEYYQTNNEPNIIRLKNMIDNKKIKPIAKKMAEHLSVFSWRKGDFLIIDNRKIIHGGLPGMGPRTIHAILCNPLDLTHADNGVIQLDKLNPSNRSVFEKLQEFSESRSSLRTNTSITD